MGNGLFAGNMGSLRGDGFIFSRSVRLDRFALAAGHDLSRVGRLGRDADAAIVLQRYKDQWEQEFCLVQGVTSFLGDWADLLKMKVSSLAGISNLSYVLVVGAEIDLISCADQGFRHTQVGNYHRHHEGNHERNNKESNRTATMKRSGAFQLPPRQNTQREPMSKRKHKQEHKHPKWQKPEGSNLRKCEFQPQGGRVKEPAADAERQHQNQLYNALKHCGHIAHVAVLAGQDQMKPIRQEEAERNRDIPPRCALRAAT